MKSDSRVSIRHPGQGTPAPLSQRVVMPDSLPKYTDRTADMTGLIARRAQLEAATTGRTWSRASERIPRLARCSVFKDRSAPAAKGLSERARTASRATTQYIGQAMLDPVLSYVP